MRTKAVPVIALLLLASGALPAQEGAAGAGLGADWETSRAQTSVSDLTSVQRGARNFLSYCQGCHSLKYERYARMATDLKIPDELLARDLVPPGDKPTDYILTSMPAADAETWFGKVPPDLSLMASERGVDYLYRFLTTFYVDPTRPTGANNMQLATTAMPDVLSELEGLKRAVYKNVESKDAEGKSTTTQVFDHFEMVAPGRMDAAQYDRFVRDTVNFLDYVSEPTQSERHALGVWVVLFLLVFTWFAWLMKQEYWKDVH